MQDCCNILKQTSQVASCRNSCFATGTSAAGFSADIFNWLLRYLCCRVLSPVFNCDKSLKLWCACQLGSWVCHWPASWNLRRFDGQLVLDWIKVIGLLSVVTVVSCLLRAMALSTDRQRNADLVMYKWMSQYLHVGWNLSELVMFKHYHHSSGRKGEWLYLRNTGHIGFLRVTRFLSQLSVNASLNFCLQFFLIHFFGPSEAPRIERLTLLEVGPWTIMEALYSMRGNAPTVPLNAILHSTRTPRWWLGQIWD